MNAKANTVKVGLFTLTIILAFFVVLIWISKGVSGPMQSAVIHFKPSPVMPTLSAGSAVLIGGQRVGRVKTADLAAVRQNGADDWRVVVEVEFREGLVLKADCSAFAEGPPLGGDGLIKINLGDKPEAFKGDYIPGAEPGGFAAMLASMQSELDATNPGSLLWQLKSQLDPASEASLMAKLHQSFNDINLMTGALANQFGPADTGLLAKLHAIADNISQTTAGLRREFDAGQREVLIAKLHIALDEINDSLAVVNRMMHAGEAPVGQALASVEKMAANLAKETDADAPDSLMTQIKLAGQKINASLDDFNAVSKTTRDVLVLNRENLNRMLVNFKESSDHIRTGVKYVLRNPWRLMNAPKPTEQKQQAIFDAARSFAEAATRIDDATARLRALSELHDGNIPLDDADLKQIMADLRTTQEKYQRAETEFWEQLGVQ